MIAIGEAPTAKTQMLIRRPVADVFDAFIDPAVTAKFWFTKSSGKLEAGKRVRWDWEMYGVGTDVEVKEIEPGRRILIEWSFPRSNTVEWLFDGRADGTTLVAIANRGFKGDGDAQVAQALDSAQGFSIVLAGAKAFLEHGLVLNLIGDKAPDARVKD